MTSAVAGEDRRLRVDRRVAGEHADVLGAEGGTQREELLRHQSLDRCRPDPALAARRGCRKGRRSRPGSCPTRWASRARRCCPRRARSGPRSEPGRAPAPARRPRWRTRRTASPGRARRAAARQRVMAAHPARPHPYDRGGHVHVTCDTLSRALRQMAPLCPYLERTYLREEAHQERGRRVRRRCPAGCRSAATGRRRPRGERRPTAASAKAAAHRSDNRPGPQTKERIALRKAAIAKVAAGKAKANDDGVVQLGANKFAETTTQKQDKIFTILSEFGDRARQARHRARPAAQPDPQPDRTKDNSTTWEANFDKSYYENLFFGAGESFEDFYRSSRPASTRSTNTVSDWVKVPDNASTYGDNPVEDLGGPGSSSRTPATPGTTRRRPRARRDAEIKAYLAQFDVWDRYDYDNDGNFNEPDGYIDHFQAVHAGEGEDAGGGARARTPSGRTAGTSTRTDFGLTGPTVERAVRRRPDRRHRSFWIGDYTVEAENGGLGVFAHEFGHDLGLPDFYDTNGGENGTAFWTLMSSGSWLNHGTATSIGTTPDHMGPWEKLQLGWLDYSRRRPEAGRLLHAEPRRTSRSTARTRRVIVDVPDEAVGPTTRRLPRAPMRGGRAAPTTSTRPSPAPWTCRRQERRRVTAKRLVRHRGRLRLPLRRVLHRRRRELDPGRVAAHRLRPTASWKTLRYASPAERQHARSASATRPTAACTSPAPSSTTSPSRAAAPRCSPTTSRAVTTAGPPPAGSSDQHRHRVDHGDRYYLVENRTYVGYDAHAARPARTSSARPDPTRLGRALPVPGRHARLDGRRDLRGQQHHRAPSATACPAGRRAPGAVHLPGRDHPSNRRQPFDATFGLQATDAVCLHKQVLGGTKQSPTVQTLAACAPSNAGIPTFDDSVPNRYWSSADPIEQRPGRGSLREGDRHG